MFITYQDTYVEQKCDDGLANRKSRAKNLNDIRSSIRATLYQSRLYSRSVQVMQKRITLLRSLRTGFNDPCTNQSEYCKSGTCNDSDFDPRGYDESCCSPYSDNFDRSPSPTSSLTSSGASSDSSNFEYQSVKLPRFMLEVKREQSRRRKPVEKFDRIDLFKSRQKFNKRRVEKDESKIIEDYHAFKDTLFRYQTDRAIIAKLLSQHWQVLTNVLYADDEDLSLDCVSILTSLLEQNLISISLLTEMLQNNLLSVLYRCTQNGVDCCIITCRYLMTMFKTYPACTPMILEMLSLTELPDSFITSLIESYTPLRNEYLTFLHYIIQVMIEDISSNSNEIGQSLIVPSSWTILIQPKHLRELSNYIFNEFLAKAANFTEDLRVILPIFANVLKISCANVDPYWARRILGSYFEARIYKMVSKLLEKTSHETNCSPDHDEIVNHCASFISLYQQLVPDLCSRYNITPATSSDQNYLEHW